jgi:hypothetical protein
MAVKFLDKTNDFYGEDITIVRKRENLNIIGG